LKVEGLGKNGEEWMMNWEGFISLMGTEVMRIKEYSRPEGICREEFGEIREGENIDPICCF